MEVWGKSEELTNSFKLEIAEMEGWSTISHIKSIKQTLIVCKDSPELRKVRITVVTDDKLYINPFRK